MTGNASLDSAIRAVRAGAYDYLTKSCSLRQLGVIPARMHDRIALEAQGLRFQFAPPLADYPGRPGSETLERRLNTIERSLARIERSLGVRSH